MAVNKEVYNEINKAFSKQSITLVAVSKTKPVNDIQELYDWGQKDFGENYVQELVEKESLLPKNTRWHLIGHLQTNKVRYIAPFVYMIHGIDSLKLLKEVNKQAEKSGRVIPVLLQVFIAKEETKFGLDEHELYELLQNAVDFKSVSIKGLMGMASFSNDERVVRSEFRYLKSLFDNINSNINLYHAPLTILSMGMSSDYKLAIEEGSNMVRIGSLLFGARG